VKTFSPEMELCRQGRSHDIAWLAELDWDDGFGRYSSRPVTIGGFAYRPILVAIQGLRLAMPSVVPGDGERCGAARIELVNTAEEGDQRFEILAESQGLEGRTVRVGFVFLDPDVVLESSDIVWIQTYQIEAAVLETCKAILYVRESPEVAGQRLAGRKLLPSLDPTVSAASLGQMIPLIFGRVERSRLLPFRVGRRGLLRVALQPEHTMVWVEDAGIFPDAGTVQIEDEIIVYAAVDRTNHTLGRDDSPVVRAAPAYHRPGTAVDWIPEGGFEYLVADHPCHEVGSIYSGSRVVDAAAYTIETEQLDGREVQKVVFPQLPTEVSYGSVLQTRRIDGRADENLWGSGDGNAAESALSAVDGAGQATAAVLAATQTPLEIEYLGDLSAGATIFGQLRRCRLSVEFSASQRWSVASEIRVTVGRGGESVTHILNRPPLDENSVTFPAHSHADTIRDEVADIRELFEVAQQRIVVDFDEAVASGGGWTDRERATDGNLGTSARNTLPGGERVTSPLTFRLLRQPLAGSESTRLDAVEYALRIATDESASVLAALDAMVAGKYADSWTVEAGLTAKTYICTIAAQNLTVEDLVASTTAFAVRSLDGRQVKVFGAWLTLRYRPRVAGQERTVSQWRSGGVEAAAPIPIALPTKLYQQEFDLTDFILSHGEWGFFAPQADERPFVRVSFDGSADATAVRISAIGFEAEYAPRLGVEVFERFEATVEGIEKDGELVTNPAEVIEWLVTDSAGLNWSPQVLDEASFAQARAWLEARHWQLSRRIGTVEPVAILLQEIARESGCRLYWEAGRLRLRPLGEFPLSSEAVATLDSSVILAAPLAKRLAPIREAANVLRLRYGGEDSDDALQWLEMFDAGSAAAAWGQRVREFRARWLASSASELALRLISLWLSQTAQPSCAVDLLLPMSQSHLERGDVVIVDHPSSRLDAAVGEIAAVEFVDNRYVRATIALRRTGLYCWYGDAETFIVHLAGNTEKVFVLEGERVAALDRTGQLRLRSEVVESNLSPRAMAAAIEHDAVAGSLYFGVGDETQGYSAVFALDAEGRLILRGTAREHADLSSLSMDTCHRAEAARLLFSCDLVNVALDYEAEPDRLDLVGQIVENSLL